MWAKAMAHKQGKFCKADCINYMKGKIYPEADQLLTPPREYRNTNKALCALQLTEEKLFQTFNDEMRCSLGNMQLALVQTRSS